MFTPFADFSAYYNSNPDGVRRLAAKLLRKPYSSDEVADLAQELILFLLTPTSSGKDKVASFDPSIYETLTEKIYFGYIKYICTRHYLSLIAKSSRHSRKVSTCIEPLPDELNEGESVFFSVPPTTEALVLIGQLRDLLPDAYVPVFDLFVQGYTNAELASILCISSSEASTILTKIRKIIRRLNA